MYSPQDYSPQDRHREWSIEPVRLRLRSFTPDWLTGGWTAAAVICAAYILYIAQLTSLPFQDYPNHIARAAVMADLLFHHGATFGSVFEVHLSAMPYLLHDLLLVGCVELFGTTGGAAVFNAIVLLSLPCALLFYMHMNGLAPRARLLIFLISLYLGTDWFFIMSFTAFRLALALIIVSLALADGLRQRWSATLFAGYLAALVTGYLTHLSAPVFLLPVLIVSACVRLWFGTSNVRREALLAAPVFALVAIHFGVVAEPYTATNPPAYGFEWGDFHQKIRDTRFEFYRFGGRSMYPMMILLAGCLLWPVRKQLRWRVLRNPRVVEQLAIAAAFLGVYLLLPRDYSDSAYVDVRALPFVTLFLVLTLLYVSTEKTPARVSAAAGTDYDSLPVLAVATVLVLANLAYIVYHLGQVNAWTSRYRAIVASIPRGSYVLPIYTQSQSSVLPFLHVHSFVFLDRGGITPYLFSGDRGDPMKYFRYRTRPYMPDEFWYRAMQTWNKGKERTFQVAGETYRWRFRYSRQTHRWTMLDLAPIDWNRIACEYDYLLITMPFEAGMIQTPTAPVRANDSAALLAVDKSACHAPVPVQSPVRLPMEHAPMIEPAADE